jgi:acetolactate synthase small subunit
MKTETEEELIARITAYTNLIQKLRAVHQDRAGLEALDPSLRVACLGHVDKLRHIVELMEARLSETRRAEIAELRRAVRGRSAQGGT